VHPRATTAAKGAHVLVAALCSVVHCDSVPAKREVFIMKRWGAWFVSAAMASLGMLSACQQLQVGSGVPRFAVDPYWPKPLPDNWILGQVSGIAVDKNDHIWIVHRPGTLLDDEKGAMQHPPATRCCTPAPPVLEFDAGGNLYRSWGGPGKGYDWPESEHGIYIDDENNVWLAGNGAKDQQILKFTPDGKFLKQFGGPGSVGGSNSETRLGRPANVEIDSQTNELYVADGYGNRRVLVLDARTGAYKRHWGAYGNRPSDEKLPPYDPDKPLSRQFGNPVHCARLSRDGLVYVCDRANDRIQVFERSGRFVREFRIEPATRQNGSVWDLVLSEDRGQKFLFMADGANGQVLVLERASGKVLSSFGRSGRMAGEFKWVHNIAVDSKGNLYTSEVGSGRRAQKFTRVK
jgi:DNA-binding beta-propeller fold protein YncE